MQEINWPYSFNEASEDKTTWRTSSQSPIWELAGIDGTVSGALRPHPGMKDVWTFRFDLVDAADFGGTNPYVTNAQYATVEDFWPFTCKIGASSLTYGVVYVAKRPKSTVRDLIIEGFRTDTNQFYQKAILTNQSSASAIGVNALINVSSTPRVVYVTIKGIQGYAAMFPGSGPNPTIVSSGPGRKPLGAWEPTSQTSYTPTTTLLPDPTAVVTPANPPGSFVVYSTLVTAGAPTGGWFDTATRWGTATSQKAGDYAFAVQFEDSLSGRRSQLSDSVPVTFTGSNRKFTAIGIVDTAKYDTVKIWRSVRNTNAAGVFAAGILQLEAVFKASDYAISPASPTYGAGVVLWAYAVQKDDRQLVMQDTFQDKPAFLSSVPFGGASASYQSQLFVSGISGQSSDTEDQMRSVGEIRWSSATDGSYELFAPKARWTPDIHGDDPICFKQAGQILLGFSKSKVFFILRDGAFVRVSTAHNGYGVTGKYAAETVGPMVYYLTRQGMRAVYPDGRLDEIGATDWLITNDWQDDLASMSMAYDVSTSALYVLNPNNKRAIVMWFASGMCSEMHCFPFKKCARGYFPAKTEYADSAVFLLSPSLDEDASVSGYIPSSFRPRLMRVAQDSTDRVWEPPSFLYEGQVHYGLIDGACDRNVKLTNTVEVTTPSGTYYEFWWTTRGVNGWTPTWTIIGSYCCVPSDGAIGVSKFGLRYFQIIGIIAGGSQHKVLCREVDSIDNFCTEVNPVGNATHLTINPVVFKIGTSPMPGVIPTTGFMTNKEVTSTGVMLAACELSPAMGKTVDADSVFPRWFAGVYSGDSYFPFSIGTPVNPSKQANSISIVDGASPIHAPFDKKLDTYQSVTFLANAVGMDFRVIAMNVRGRILETERNKNSYA
jgi:hypothetical protein